MDRMDQELNSLFAAYREAVPDPEPSADFMPRLWSRIEAKRSFVFRLRRMSQVAVAAALAACLLGGVLILPFSNRTSQVAGTYVDILADAHGDEAIAAAGGFRLDLLDAADQH
jgi:hypothetical protein